MSQTIAASIARRSARKLRCPIKGVFGGLDLGYNQGSLHHSSFQIVGQTKHLHATALPLLKILDVGVNPASTHLRLCKSADLLHRTQYISSRISLEMKRGFASEAGLPLYQEIGMPSLSPTMTQGNIARWRKKEGDKVLPGDVICEIETDKATLDMESMEEGYLAKIVKGDGSTDIKVGEVIAIMVEEEADVEKLKNFEVSGEKAPSEAPSKKADARPSQAKDLPPHQELGMPSLSPTMTQGNIVRWRKQEGDKVSPGDVLCEIETDKATLDMESMEEGYLAKIVKDDGSTDIKVGEVIAIMVDEETDVEKFKNFVVSGERTPKEASSKTTDTVPRQPKTESQSSAPTEKSDKFLSSQQDRIFASPLARKLAADHNVPISSIKGTGPDGRIIKADIEDYIGSAKRAEVSPAKPAETLDYIDIPHSQIRKVTASRLLLSKQTIPHYYLTVDTRVDKLMQLRSQLNSLQEASGSKRISVNDFVIKAAALALRKVPQCNSSWTDQYIRQYHNVNISVAVQTENGLFVPVVKDADKKGLSAIAEDVKILAQKAKENALKPSDYEGGTFTVSNLGGPFGIKQFCAIINPPQSAILAVGSAEKRAIPGLQADQFDVGSYMSVTLSCDHRVIDGAIGAAWLGAFKAYIEDPMTMLL